MMGRIVLLAAIASCADEEPPYDGPCWPLPSEPGGDVELGTGNKFEAMPDVLEVTTSSIQTDSYLQIQARIHGIPGGNADSALDPANPRTMVKVEIPDVAVVLGPDCPATRGYVPSANPDTSELLSPFHLGFGYGFPIDTVEGKQARIVLEVVGSNGLHARTEKVVTLVVPPRETE
jgi:hypothetical protein